MHREVYLSAVMDAIFLDDGDTVLIALRNSNYLRLFSLAKLEVRAFSACVPPMPHLVRRSLYGAVW